MQQKFRIRAMDATEIPEIPKIRNSDRILGIQYNPEPKSSEKLNPVKNWIRNFDI